MWQRLPQAMIICQVKRRYPHVDCTLRSGVTGGAGLVTLLIFGWVRVAFSAMTGQDASLVGRGTELSLLRELVAPPPESRVKCKGSRWTIAFSFSRSLLHC